MAKKNFRYWLIFTLFALLPVGWSKHWLISQNLVSGVLVDYLMPALWFQDVLVIILLTTYLLTSWRKNKFKAVFKDKRFWISLALILPALVFSAVPLISLIYFLRFLLAAGAGYLLMENRSYQKPAQAGLKLALIWTSALALLQFVKQGTVFGWWFLGEPVFSSGSGGVKKIILLGRTLVMPMATFPHFNVLIGFLILSLIVLKKKIWCWLATGLVLFKIITFEPTSLWRRWELVKISLAMVRGYPLFGVGWGCFVKRLPEYWQSNFRFLQPVHNIFLIMFSELGSLGSLGIILFVSKLFRHLLKRKYLLLNTCFLILFLFDHYFWTTTQGIYMLFLFLSLV